MRGLVRMDGETAKAMFRALNTLVNEAVLMFKDDALLTTAVDPANIALVSLMTEKNSLEEYSVDEEMQVGVNVERIYDMLKNVRKRDLVELKVDEETISLRMGFVEYTMSLIDPSAIRKPPKTPELELLAKVVLDAGQFKDAVNLASKVTDEITLSTNEDAFILEAKGDTESIKLELDNMDLIEFNGAEARSTFAVEYLKEFNKIASKGDLLTIHLGNGLPARFVYEVADSKLTIEYLLAPRINTEW